LQELLMPEEGLEPRQAVALFTAGFGLVNVADGELAHAIGAACLMVFEPRADRFIDRTVQDAAPSLSGPGPPRLTLAT
jgi:hypothetical protein